MKRMLEEIYTSLKAKLLYEKKYYFIKKQIKEKNQKIFLLGAPFHGNMGDQAQTYCSLLWFGKNYPDYASFSYNTRDLAFSKYKLLRIIKKFINKNDIIFLHSGYHVTDLYMFEENMNRKAIELFPDNKIVVLPQTISFKDDAEKNRTAEIYNKHKDITILCRDDLSFETARDMFVKCRLLKYPDIVTTLIGTRSYDKRRDGILMCMRNDIEAFYSKNDITLLKKKLEGISHVDITDTTLDLDPDYISGNRERVLNGIFEEYSKYQVVITDRYHGVIFSLVANTPVLVLSSADHKLISGVKWFPESFREYIEYIEDINIIPGRVKEIFNKTYQYRLPNYFNEEFYDRLKDDLK